jgi:hypothetical protein
MSGQRRDCVCPRIQHRHGTHNAYLSDRCRCPDCRAAHARRTRQRRRQAVHSEYGVCPPPTTWVVLTGSRRRLEALATLGWSSTDLAPMLGCRRSMVEAWRRGGGNGCISSTTAADIAEVYERISDQPSTGRYAKRTRNWAQRMRFIPPIGWDDDTIDNPAVKPFAAEPVLIDPVAVSEALAGRTVPLTRAERAEAIRIGASQGATVSTLERQLPHASRPEPRTPAPKPTRTGETPRRHIRIPDDLWDQLTMAAGPRGRSAYVLAAVRKALEGP